MKLDSICNQVYVVALNEARMQRHEYLTPEHFLYATTMFDIGREILEKSGGDVTTLKKDILEFLESEIPRGTESPVDSFNFIRMLELGTAQAHGSGKNVVILGDLLAAIYNLHESHACYFMQKNGIERLALLKAISHETPHYKESSGSKSRGKRTSKDKDFLQAYTTNLTDRAKNGVFDPLVGREDVLERTAQVLSRRLKNNPIHVGDPGVGKTSIVEGLATQIVKGAVPDVLIGAQIYYMDMGALLAGTKYRGDFEERLIKLMEIISKIKKPILYIDEIHTVVGAGAVSGGGMDATAILKPYLAKGHVRFIGSTTFEEYKKYFEKDRALSRRFQRIDVQEPSEEACYEILLGLKERYEQYHNVVYTEEILKLAAQLSAKYMRDRYLPDKAIDVIDEAGAYARMKSKKSYTYVLVPKDIERTVALIAKIPEKNVTGNEGRMLKDLSKHIKEEIFGQDEAVDIVVNAIKASRSGLNDEEKPVASLLFVGPTGVGKTEIVRQLAQQLNIQLVRYDMSEYQEKHSVARLIGAPPGYVGYEEGGLLTEAMRKTPHCVLLLDEIEKAHSDIYNVLLQIMDYGSLTDNVGKKADFRNVILVMTSNAGAKEMGKKIIGFDAKIVDTSAINKEVERIFNPEFRNRLDGIVVFKHINKDMSLLIANKAIKQLAKRLESKDVHIDITARALEHIAEKGLSPLYGAREIMRVVDKDIKKQLVDEVLFGKLSGGGKVTVDVKGEALHVTCNRAKP